MTRRQVVFYIERATTALYIADWYTIQSCHNIYIHMYLVCNIYNTSIQITLNHVDFQRENGLENEKVETSYCLWIYAWMFWTKTKYEIGVTKNHYAELLKPWRTGRIPFLLWFFPAQYTSMSLCMIELLHVNLFAI